VLERAASTPAAEGSVALAGEGGVGVLERANRRRGRGHRRRVTPLSMSPFSPGPGNSRRLCRAGRGGQHVIVKRVVSCRLERTHNNARQREPSAHRQPQTCGDCATTACAVCASVVRRGRTGGKEGDIDSG
jgi:hypothetical protein